MSCTGCGRELARLGAELAQRARQFGAHEYEHFLPGQGAEAMNAIAQARDITDSDAAPVAGLLNGMVSFASQQQQRSDTPGDVSRRTDGARRTVTAARARFCRIARNAVSDFGASYRA